TTGSQGEPMSALYRMSDGSHNNVHIRENDLVILSSNPVPGNERDVSDIVNSLMEQGAEVLYNDIAETHVSGHACEEELKLIHTLLRPKFFMPVHGEVRHLLGHARIARNLGMPDKNIIYANNGDVIEVTRRSITLTKEKVDANPVLVDGLGVGDIGNSVLNERKNLSESGLIVIAAIFDPKGKLVSGPQLHTRGFIFVKEYGALLDEARAEIMNALEDAASQGIKRPAMEKLMVDKLRSFIYKKTKRSPAIVPVFMEV
ncbi:MAG: ribonuclease J, partial [Firmicutes bacterium]|nr:ribonuclease J [Bacillota bacterium]